MIRRLTIFLLLLTGFCTCSLKKIILPNKGICAHRGAMDTHPENTLAAFKEAVSLGVQMIELDVRMTKDEQLVIMHDETVDRTTNGSGAVNDLTFKEIRALDAGSWKAPAFDGELVPTFKESLDVIPQDVWINVHLKGGNDLGRKTARELVKYKRKHHAFVACGKEAAKGVRAVDPTLMICNMERQTNETDYIAGTLKEGSTFIQFYKTPINPQLAKYCDELKSHGIMINYCCTDNQDDMEKLFEYGVDFVLVNEAGRMLEVARENGIVFDAK